MSTKKDIITTTAAAGIGAGIGATAIRMSGMTAVGMVGGGAGVGSAASPVGTAVGALAGVTLLSLACTVHAAQRDPAFRKAVKATRQKVGQWISGDDTNDQ